MSLAAFAAINGALALGILGALAYVCRLPFRLDDGPSLHVAVAPIAPTEEAAWEELAA